MLSISTLEKLIQALVSSRHFAEYFWKATQMLKTTADVKALEFILGL